MNSVSLETPAGCCLSASMCKFENLRGIDSCFTPLSVPKGASLAVHRQISAVVRIGGNICLTQSPLSPRAHCTPMRSKHFLWDCARRPPAEVRLQPLCVCMCTSLCTGACSGWSDFALCTASRPHASQKEANRGWQHFFFLHLSSMRSWQPADWLLPLLHLLHLSYLSPKQPIL